MAILKATTITPYVLDWLERTTAVSILHRFDRVCNVVNQANEVVSLVVPSIGAGPFAIVLGEEWSGMWEGNEQIRIDNANLVMDNLEVDISDCVVWQPKPNWGILRERLSTWIGVVPQIRKMAQDKRQMQDGIGADIAQRLHQLEAKLIHAVADDNLVDFKTAVSQIAGLGGGLTPAGDDFLVGVLYGLFATHAESEVQRWADVVEETGTTRTTTLSGAWLGAAARGEAIVAWHDLCQTLIMSDEAWKLPVLKILDIGHSSGSDALAGFTAVIQQVLIE